MTFRVRICVAALSVGVCVGPRSSTRRHQPAASRRRTHAPAPPTGSSPRSRPSPSTCATTGINASESIEGVRLARQHPRRRDAHGICQHQPRRAVPRRRLPHGLVRRQGRPPDDARSARARAWSQPEPVEGDKQLMEARWRSSFELAIPADLAERRVSRQADQRAIRRPELRHLGRPRRSQGRPDVPGVRPHVAGLQPLARVAVALRLEAGTLAHDAWREGQLRPAVHLLLQHAAGDAARR